METLPSLQATWLERKNNIFMVQYYGNSSKLVEILRLIAITVIGDCLLTDETGKERPIQTFMQEQTCHRHFTGVGKPNRHHLWHISERGRHYQEPNCSLIQSLAYGPHII